jgi:hypothetical protein
LSHHKSVFLEADGAATSTTPSTAKVPPKPYRQRQVLDRIAERNDRLMGAATGSGLSWAMK